MSKINMIVDLQLGGVSARYREGVPQPVTQASWLKYNYYGLSNKNFYDISQLLLNLANLNQYSKENGGQQI